MKLIFKYFLVVLLVLVITACSAIKDPQLVSIENVDVQSNNEYLSVVTDLKIYNPNRFALRSKDVNIELFMDDLFVGNISLLSTFNVKKQDTLKLRSRLNLEPHLFQQNINLNDTLNLRIKGSAKVSFIPLNYKFDIDHQLMLSDLLDPLLEKKLKDSDIIFKTIRIENIKLSRIDIISGLKFKNNFNFDYSIDKLNVKIFDSKQHNNLVGESDIDEPIEVKKQSEIDIESAISLNTAKLGKSIIKNLFKKRYTLYVKVNAILVLNKIKFPITVLREVHYNPITQEIKIKQ
jgi:LEA14-like dessication related protein